MNTNTGTEPCHDGLKQSEERLRFALEVSNQGIWDWNIQTGEIFFSPSWKKLFGFTDDDVVNSIREWDSRIHPDDREQLTRDLQTHFNSSQPVYENCYRLQAKDGTYRWIQGRGKIVSRAPDGTPLRMLGTHTDITEKKETEEQHRHLFNITPLPIWVYDFETLQFLAVNEAALAHYGYTRNEFLRMTIFDIRPPECRALLSATLPHREAQHKTTYSNWQHQKKNGDIIVVELNSTTISYNGRKARLVVVNDITQKVAAEAELKRSHQWFQYVTKATSDAIYELDIIKGSLVWGEGLTTLFGHAAQDVTMAQWEAYIHPDERQAVVGYLDATIRNSQKKFWKMEYRFATAEGAYRYVIDKGFIIRDSERRPLRMIGAMQDITTLKQKQLELEESNKRYVYATLATSDVIWDWALDRGCVLWSDNYGNVTGWALPPDKCIPVETCLERFHEKDRAWVFNSMNAALETPEQRVWEAEHRYLMPNGDVAHIYNRAYILRTDDGTATRMIGAMQDITQRKKLEDQLLQKELDKQRMIGKATVETQERERSEIGKELHDNVNQVLTTTKLYLELAQSRPEMRDDILQKSQQNIGYVINEIRQLSHSLMNPSLGDLGLIDSIHDLVENVQATRKIKVAFEHHGCCNASLSENLDLTIYRIIQEALHNAVRHAQATTVTISLQQNEADLRLLIQDDGIGFNPETTKKGAGLKNIQNRVYLANGSLEIRSEPGAGCRLVISFNLQNTTTY